MVHDGRLPGKIESQGGVAAVGVDLPDERPALPGPQDCAAAGVKLSNPSQKQTSRQVVAVGQDDIPRTHPPLKPGAASRQVVPQVNRLAGQGRYGNGRSSNFETSKIGLDGDVV